MVISLPKPAALQKETTEKTLEIKVPLFAVKLTDNKFVSAFKAVLQAPVN